MIEDYHIVILSAEHFNAIIYEGPKKDKQIYLYLHQNHYDIITSVSAFLGKNYCCLECKKGYDKNKNIVVAKCASVVSLKVVKALPRKHRGESVVVVTESLLATNATLTIAHRTKPDSQCSSGIRQS